MMFQKGKEKSRQSYFQTWQRVLKILFKIMKSLLFIIRSETTEQQPG